MFVFHPIHFLKFLVKSQPQRSCKKGSYIKKRVYYGQFRCPDEKLIYFL